LTSTIVKKVIMALTGLVWIGFIFFHMYGNLKIFVGPSYYNEYAEGLRHLGAPIFGHLHVLTLLRVGIVVSIVLHVWAAISLTRQARAARSTRYVVKRTVQADYASITMRYGGTMLLLFILFHLADLTWGVAALSPDFVKADPYANVVSTFQSLPVIGFYLLALIALGFHLYHGTWSLFQTLGLLNSRMDKYVRTGGLLLAVVIVGGFAAVPLSVLFGLLS
jgi:succinate dehydrogenase / fumarate reductase cytochrome b subunit